MPTYHYKCEHCGHELETFHGISEKLESCPECGKDTLGKVLQPMKKIKTETSKRTGAIVDSYIKDAKKEVEREKKTLREREVK